MNHRSGVGGVRWLSRFDAFRANTHYIPGAKVLRHAYWHRSRGLLVSREATQAQPQSTVGQHRLLSSVPARGMELAKPLPCGDAARGTGPTPHTTDVSQREPSRDEFAKQGIRFPAAAPAGRLPPVLIRARLSSPLRRRECSLDPGAGRANGWRYEQRTRSSSRELGERCSLAAAGGSTGQRALAHPRGFPAPPPYRARFDAHSSRFPSAEWPFLATATELPFAFPAPPPSRSETRTSVPHA
jgi:hypothetical protein